MTDTSVINPVENIRLSSELWKNNAAAKMQLLQKKTIGLCDRLLITQVNFTDRMKQNAKLAQLQAQTPMNRPVVSTVPVISDFFNHSLTAITRQIHSLITWAAVKAQTLSKTISLMRGQMSAKLVPAAKERLAAAESFADHHIKQPASSIARHPVKVFTIVLFTGLIIYVAITATQAFVNTNW